MRLPRSNNSRFCRPSSRLLHGRTLREAHTRCLSHAGEILRSSLPQTPVIGRKKIESLQPLTQTYLETDWMMANLPFTPLRGFLPPPTPSPRPPLSILSGKISSGSSDLINFGGGRASLPRESAINATTNMIQKLPNKAFLKA